MATWAQIMFQDSSSPLMEQLMFFHDHSIMILILITSLVSYLIFMLMTSTQTNRFFLEWQTMETIWTIIPACILLLIALQSLQLLCLLDETHNASLSIKSIGHQWYWSYEYTDFKKIDFNSYMKYAMNLSSFRLLDVDNRMTIPMNIQTRIMISSADELHAWAIPSLGIKTDAVPGWLNQKSFLIKRPGVWYGQCSEICGANHTFMPIVIETTHTKTFITWIKSFM